MSSQKLERKYMYIGFEPKAITAHLNMSSIRVTIPMEENKIIRASSTYLAMSIENRLQTIDIYDLIKSSCDNKTTQNTKLSKQIGILCELPHQAQHVLFNKLYGPGSRISNVKLTA